MSPENRGPDDAQPVEQWSPDRLQPQPTGPMPARTRGLAIASLVLGLAGLLTCGLTALVGLILGIVALARIGSSRRAGSGFGLAIAGTTVSGVVLLIVPVIALLAAMLMPALSRARFVARRVACKANLHHITIGIGMYRDDHDQRWPESLGELYPEYVESREAFVCPADENPMTIEGRECSYHYAGRLPGGVPPMTIILYDKRGNHPGGRNALFADAHVEWLDEDEFHRRLERNLEKLEPGIKGMDTERQQKIRAFYEDRAGP